MESYDEDSIRSLDWREHIRLRPGMYIGKLGDGSSPDDGIYVLLKEVLDNSIDEHVMGHGEKITIQLDGLKVSIRDFGRGIPLGKLLECAAKINTGAKYDSKVFKRSVGLNGVGIKAVNALSSSFRIQAFREGKTRWIDFKQGLVKDETKRDRPTTEPNGTLIEFTPDQESFGEEVAFNLDTVRRMLRYYSYLNPKLTLVLNGEPFHSENGLRDLLKEEMTGESLYPIIHLVGEDVEVALTHVDESYGEDYYSFVNGQNTTQGGTHLAAFREAVVKTARDFYKKNFEPSDVRTGLMAVVSVKVAEPVFESQTKTKLGSTHMEPDGRTVRGHLMSFITMQLDNYLHRDSETARAMLEKIQRSEKERKDLSGIQKMARESAKKAKVHNKKLRDCKIHFDSNHKDRHLSTIFLVEGDSASGPMTQARDVNTQAVFSLRGKPLNVFGLSRKVVYQNEEFNFLQHALNIEDGLDGLRYNRVVLATDADVDGMHIRLLLMTFFLQFFPELVRHGHLYILQTPLFRVRNKKETRYCYTEMDLRIALRDLGKHAERTRFKGLGEISPGEFAQFIGKKIRLEPVRLDHEHDIKKLLTYYMGKNTPERQNYIIDNLRIEQGMETTEEVLLKEAE